jgi:predicted nucleotidyltransferase component of viral defense system
VTAPGLDPAEANAVAERFGVALDQVRRDHLISHILAALSARQRDEVIFFGGTALARTHLPDGRYADALPATLRVPTRAAFAAWKTVAWHDRAAPRDLYDLWSLASQSHIGPDAAKLFVIHGPTGQPPQRWMFATAPTDPPGSVTNSGFRRIQRVAR